MSKCSSDLQFFSLLLTAMHLFLLGWFHSLFEAFLWQVSMALASPTSWALQSNSGFTFKVSSNVLSIQGHPWNMSDLNSFSDHSEISENLFLLFWKPEARVQSCQVLLLSGNGRWPLVQPAFYFWLFPSLLKLGCPESERFFYVGTSCYKLSF